MATQEKVLTSSYQLLGAGPLLVALETGHLARLVIDTSLPAVDAPATRLVRGTNREFLEYPGSDNVYGRKEATASEIVLVSYNGI